MENILYITAILILLLALIYLTLKGTGKKKDPVLKQHYAKVISETVLTDFNSVKNGLFELDKLVDRYLKNSKIKGETMGERLKSASKLFQKDEYNKIWEAHKIRNTLAHEVQHNIDLKTLQNAYNNMRKIISNYI